MLRILLSVGQWSVCTFVVIWADPNINPEYIGFKCPISRLACGDKTFSKSKMPVWVTQITMAVSSKNKNGNLNRNK